MMQFLFQNGDTALHIAAAMGRRKLTKILLESGCDKDAKNKQNETAMDISRRKELAEIVSILQNPPPVLSEKDREDQAMAARDRSQSHPRPSKSDKKREKTSTSSKENHHERGSKREKKRVSVSGPPILRSSDSARVWNVSAPGAKPNPVNQALSRTNVNGNKILDRFKGHSVGQK